MIQRRLLLARTLGLGLLATAFSASTAFVACGDGPKAATPTAAPTLNAAASATAAAALPPKSGPTPKAAPSVGPITLDNPTVTASGLKYVDQVVGTGASPRADQSVTVNYTGLLAATGLQFDASAIHGGAQTFPLAGVIKGFSEGISTMKVGGKRTVYIPAALAYGANPPQGIPANADLVFQIELVGVK